MIPVINDIDRLLQDAPVRVLTPNNADIILTLSASAFHLTGAGEVDIGSITVAAVLIGIEGTIAFDVQGATSSNVTERSIQVHYDGQAAIVTASIDNGGEVISRPCIIPVMKDGADGGDGAAGEGARGAGQYYAAGTQWSDGVADAATPGGNVVGDQVTISNEQAVYSHTRRWDGSAWVIPGAHLAGDLFIDGSINGAKLKAGSVDIRKEDGTLLLGAGGEFGAKVTARNLEVGARDNLVPDPSFKDLGWWNLEGKGARAEWPGPASGWKSGASFYMAPTGGVETDTRTDLFPIVPGATYRVEYVVNVSPGFSGKFSPYLHFPYAFVHSLEAPDTGENWANGEPVAFNAPGWRRHAFMLEVPASCLPAVEFILRLQSTAGSVEIGDFSITRMTDADTMKQGVLSAIHMQGDTLDVLAAYIGKLVLGASGHIRQGQTAYDVGNGFFLGADESGNAVLSMATGNGGKLLFNPAGGIFKLVNPQVDNPKVSTAFSISISDIDSLQNPTNQAAIAGTAVTISNGIGPYTYTWVFSPGAFLSMISNPSASEALIRCEAGTGWRYGYLSVTVKDEGSGATDSATCNVRFQMGSGVEP